jgi:hypothetical protein
MEQDAEQLSFDDALRAHEAAMIGSGDTPLPLLRARSWKAR